MIETVIGAVCYFAGGMIIGHAVARNAAAKRKRQERRKPLNAGVTIISDPSGDIRFEGVITRNDFCIAYEKMPKMDRDFIKLNRTDPEHTLSVLYTIFFHMPKNRVSK